MRRAKELHVTVHLPVDHIIVDNETDIANRRTNMQGSFEATKIGIADDETGIPAVSIHGK